MITESDWHSCVAGQKLEAWNWCRGRNDGQQQALKSGHVGPMGAHGSEGQGRCRPE